MTIKYTHMIVSGKVQGVGFRYYCQQTAISHHITGWVRNKPNGDVENEAQGEETMLTLFFAKIKQGPPFSKVLDIESNEIHTLSSFEQFSILTD